MQPMSEQERMAIMAAHDTGGLDGDPKLASITNFAARLCDAPIALVSLVDYDRQWFPARTGLDATETPRAVSFCTVAMYGLDVMVVPDATRDPRFADNPLVTGAPNIRFYAGVPLKSADDAPLGTLCVIDTRPREGLADLEREGLQVLAANVAEMLSARRTARHANRQYDEQEQRFRVLADTMPQMVWSTRPDGFHDYYNARWYEYTGVPYGSTDGEAWNGMFHPDDQDRAWAMWRHSLATGEPYEIEYRLRNTKGDYRWTLGRALPILGPDGAVVRWFGTCTDIHDHKLLLEQREVVAHELSHRIKNIFSIISGLITFSARNHPEIKPAVDDLRERISALGRAHDFVRPHSAASRPSRPATSLHGMLEELLSPYRGSDGDRFVLAGTDVEIDDRSATPLALMFHELATNAMKYGALSAVGGSVIVQTQEGAESIHITWRERGGPVVTAPRTEGFGSKLIEMSVVRQLGGSITRDWRDDGLVANLTLPVHAMSREGL
jgi:PAS domain S-box-containing protein